MSETGNSSSKGGRPKKAPSDRRTVSHGLYLSEKEKTELERRADAAGLSVNEYLRRKALGGEPVTPRADEKLRNELRHIGRNLNQLARAANRGEIETVAGAVQDGIEDLREALERIE